jgi:hypothetical protein
MIYLGFLLHIYQPPDQFDEVLDRITDETYRPLLALIDSHPEARFTLNLCWSLTELLLRRGHRDCVEQIGRLLWGRRLEITGTAAYHPILPLIPAEEARRQILLNSSRHREVFGEAYQPRGFFPPEMAYDHELPQLLSSLGYDWCITEDIPFTCIHGQPPKDYVATVKGFGVLLRSALWSNKISLERDSSGRPFPGHVVARWLLRDLGQWFAGQDGYLILAMDGETFGHHIKGHIENFLVPFLDTLQAHPDKIRLVHLSEIRDRFPGREMAVPPGSWSTSAEAFWDGDFFPLWKSRYNRAHQLLWKLTELAMRGVRHLQEELDRSLNSCTYWWAAREPEQMPAITRAGVEMLLDVIRRADPASLDEARGIVRQLEECFHYHPELGTRRVHEGEAEESMACQPGPGGGP